MNSCSTLDILLGKDCTVRLLLSIRSSLQFASHSRKIANLRDRGDILSQDFISFTEAQCCCCPSTKASVFEFAKLLSQLQDYQQARIYRIEAKVVSGLSKYGFLCHTIKEEVQKGLDIRLREQRQTEEFLRLQGDFTLSGPVRQQKLESANLAASDTKRAQELLRRRSDKFEQQKLDDIRRVLLNFCEIEIAYHAKAVEVLTQAYNSIAEISLEADIETYKRELQIGPANAKDHSFNEDLKTTILRTGDNFPSSDHQRSLEDGISESSLNKHDPSAEDIVHRIKKMNNPAKRCAVLLDDSSDSSFDSACAMTGADGGRTLATVPSLATKYPQLTSDKPKQNMSRSLLEELATETINSQRSPSKYPVTDTSQPNMPTPQFSWYPSEVSGAAKFDDHFEPSPIYSTVQESRLSTGDLNPSKTSATSSSVGHVSNHVHRFPINSSREFEHPVYAKDK